MQFWDDTQDTGGQVGGAVSARFPLHQDELDVVFEDGVRFIRFPQKRRAVTLGFGRGVGDLVPDDGGQIVEAKSSAPLLNRGVQRNDRVAALVLPPRQAHVADNTDESPARNEGGETAAPNSVQLVEELLVILDIAKLPLRPVVLFQSPIWW